MFSRNYFYHHLYIMKLSNTSFFIFLLVIIIFCSYAVIYVIENFQVVENVDFYIITMKNEKRMKNIESQKAKLKEYNFETKNVHLIDAIVGKTLDLDQLVSDGILDADAYLNQDPDPEVRRETHKREVGCYLSHMKAFETILAKDKEGYSVIFEDDFNLLDNFLPILDETLVKIKNVDFDILFLGIISYHKGDNVIDNVFYIHDSEAWGAHGYLINNKSIAKIIDKMKYIDTVLDKEIFDKGRSKELTVLRLDPLIVNTDSDLASGIRGAVDYMG